jgi:hypothetical protein
VRLVAKVFVLTPMVIAVVYVVTGIDLVRWATKDRLRIG